MTPKEQTPTLHRVEPDAWHDAGQHPPPSESIGTISGIVGQIAIPGPSEDIHEAGHRLDAKEQYSEPPVPVGEFPNQEELVNLLRGHSYDDPLHFILDRETGLLVIDETQHGLVDEDDPGFEGTSRVAELLQPVTRQIIEDYARFKGDPVPSVSLVDEIAKKEDIELEGQNSGHSHQSVESLPKLRIELRGGKYEGQATSGEVTENSIYYHTDGNDGEYPGESVAYLGWIAEEGAKPLPTHVVPGVFTPPVRAGEQGIPYRPISPANGGSPFGIKDIETDPGVIYRMGFLTQVNHAAPPEGVNPGVRVFMRASIS